MKRPLIIQNAKMDSWHLIDWKLPEFSEKHQEGGRGGGCFLHVGPDGSVRSFCSSESTSQI